MYNIDSDVQMFSRCKTYAICISHRGNWTTGSMWAKPPEAETMMENLLQSAQTSCLDCSGSIGRGGSRKSAIRYKSHVN